MAAKKAAAKKVAAPDPSLSGQGTVEASGVVGTGDTLREFPLAEGDYFHPPVVSPHAHDGATEDDRAALREMQRVIGSPQSGVYDETTAAAVVAWKDERGLGRSLVVDHDTWLVLRQG